MELRTWDTANRLRNSLFDLSPVLDTEYQGEYVEIIRGLNDIYYPGTGAESHCIEMIATAMWSERRAVSAETTAMNLSLLARSKEPSLRTGLPEGVTAAELTALAVHEVSTKGRFFPFLLQYKRTQASLIESLLRRLDKIKAARQKYQPEQQIPQAA